MAWYDKRSEQEIVTPTPSDANLKALGSEYGFNIAKTKEGETVSFPWGTPASDKAGSLQFMDYWMSNVDTGRVEADRKIRNTGYKLMDAICGEAILMLDAFADEALGVGFVEDPIEIVCEDKEDQKFLNTVLYNNKLLKKGRGISRNLMKLGDLGFIIDFPLDDPRPEKMRLLPATSDKWEVKVPKTSNLPFAYKITDSSTLSRTLSKSTKSNKEQAKFLAPWELVQMSITDLDFDPYGRSILEPLRTSFDQLLTIESLLAMSRASKVERLVIKVPTGHTGNPTATLNQLQSIRSQWKNILFKDNNLGNRSYAKNPSLQDILLFPSDPDFDIDKMASSVDIASTEDAEYFRAKAIMMTKLPRGYFIADQATPRGAALQAQDIKFARTLIPVQDSLASSYMRLAMTILSYRKSRLSEVKVKVRIKRPPQLAEAMLQSYGMVTDTASRMLDTYMRTGQVVGPDGQVVSNEAKSKILKESDPRQVFLNLCSLLGMPDNMIQTMSGADATAGDSPSHYITSSSDEFCKSNLMLVESLQEASEYRSENSNLILKESDYSNLD